LNHPVFFQATPVEVDVLPLDRTAVEALGYLAYETVGQIVDVSLVLRHEEATPDPILRQMVGPWTNFVFLIRVK
jgi:hypothetical protein